MPRGHARVNEEVKRRPAIHHSTATAPAESVSVLSLLSKNQEGIDHAAQPCSVTAVRPALCLTANTHTHTHISMTATMTFGSGFEGTLFCIIDFELNIILLTKRKRPPSWRFYNQFVMDVLRRRKPP